MLVANLTAGRALYRVLHDFETDAYNHVPRQNAPTPETVRDLSDYFMDLTDGLQALWFEQLVLSAPDMPADELLRAWRGLTTSDRAFTNEHGTDRCRDYVSGKNLDMEPPRIQNLTCGGSVHLCIGGEIRAAGSTWLPFAAIDTEQPLPAVNYFTHRWLFTIATIIRPDGQVDPFPQLGGQDIPVPFLAKGGVRYLRTDRVVRLQPGELLPRSYVP